jgi:hydroxyethylthiazole kinase-like uncharacterized protein yjeF
VKPLPRALYDAASVRRLDRWAIEEAGISGVTLMERAGLAAFEVLRARWPHARRVAVVCGSGNNGGDGYVLARHAHLAGYDIEVVQVGTPGGGDAADCRQRMLAAGVRVTEDPTGSLAGDVVVDALFGIGLNKPVDGVARAAIEAINASGAPALSLDIPSGLAADSGAVLGAAVRASATCTFIGMKQGLFTGAARDHVGVVHYVDLGVPETVFARVSPTAERVTWDDCRHLLRPRTRTAHKGDYGHVLIIGGGPGMSGAARLAAEAALRVGAGLVTVAAHPSVAPYLNQGRPEIMAHGVDTPFELTPLLARATVVAIGPGLGQTAWARALFAAVRDERRPLVVDADGLNLLAADPDRGDNRILTPHPGEAARLLQVANTAAIAVDRFASVRELQCRYGGVVVLKGAGSLVEGGALPAVIAEGNPGMASGGMGDVLTGVIAALRAQGLPSAAAALAGSALHAAAADRAATAGERGLLASDLLPFIRHLVN